MAIVAYAFFTFACSIMMSIVAFLVGRCSRKLPVDGKLPQVVHTARFGAEKQRRATAGASRAESGHGPQQPGRW